MTGAHERDYYEADSHWDAAHYDSGFERERLEASARMVPKGVGTLLDIGAGNGAFLKLLENRGDDLTLLGVERSAAAIRAAQCRAPIIQGSVESLPFPDQAFELVSALNMIEHLPFGVYELALDQIRRTAARYILIGVPYRERRLRAVCPYCACEFNPHYHMRSFDENVLANLVQDFRVVSTSKVYRNESLARVLARPFRTRVFSGFPATAICPQCGFRRADGVDAQAETRDRRGGAAKALIKGLTHGLIGVPVAGEIIALFERQR